VNLGAGYTNLQKCEDLGKRIGLKNLFIKNDTTNPTYSFKDRPASVAVSKAREFHTKAVGCASTGNLAAATAAHAAKAGLPCYVFIPEGIEANKITQTAAYGARIIKVKGTYDETNRLAFQAAELHNLDIVNINLRPYYVEGSKTLAYEVCEQLDWQTPDRVIIPTASGAMLCAIEKGFREFKKLKLIDDFDMKIVCAQADGCAPIVQSFKKSTSQVEPIENPETLAHSLAIGDPGDGVYVLEKIRRSRGTAESATDKQIIEAIRLLAQTEGIFTEPAGGVSVAVLKRLAERGEIDPDERVVCYVTGNGLKSPEALPNQITKSTPIEPRLQSFTDIIGA
jgi:threonine synthase